MKLVVFGLVVSSSWGNGHATLWRGLGRALSGLGHKVVFFERDVPYYAEHRDPKEEWHCGLHLYREWKDIAAAALEETRTADVAMVTSYCPDGLVATDVVLDEARGTRVFYDMDTPVTLEALEAGRSVPYIGPRGLSEFDLVLSFTGGPALAALRSFLGAKCAVPLYGSVDPEVHHPVPARDHYRACGSYLGTYAADRQPVLEQLFLEPARILRHEPFCIAGAQYPADTRWPPNVRHFAHLAPREHSSFLCSSRITVNVTRRAMATMGYCPSGRLFEAAASGVPILSDSWPGLEQFLTPGREILVAHTEAEAVDAFRLGPKELERIGRAARTRVLDEHTAWHRAQELVELLGHTTTGPEDDAWDHSCCRAG